MSQRKAFQSDSPSGTAKVSVSRFILTYGCSQGRVWGGGDAGRPERYRETFCSTDGSTGHSQSHVTWGNMGWTFPVTRPRWHPWPMPPAAEDLLFPRSLLNRKDRETWS